VRLRHEPVLKDLAVELWAPPEARRLVDGTVGRAGHSLTLLAAREDVQLLAIDRDPEAVELAERRFAGFGDRARVVHGSYADLPRLLAEQGGGPVDGILLDLGVSSPQIDDPGRGFSTRLDGPLDLRFDRGAGVPASVWLARASAEELVRVLREFGEEPRAVQVAEAIVSAREHSPLETTARLRAVLEGVAGRRGELPAKSLARVFQALRIAVNDELGELDRFLAGLRGLLAPGGRVVIISFHSLEDRRVKRAFREAARDCLCPPELPICACGGGHAWLDVLTARPIVPGARELERNPRARSAKLRAARRILARTERCPT
jgi:16S rRNA (cytosine1402-N4)-methyltransferase